MMNLGTEPTHQTSQGVVARFCWPIMPVFWRARCGAVGADDRPIQCPLLPINGSLRVKFDLEGQQRACRLSRGTPLARITTSYTGCFVKMPLANLRSAPRCAFRVHFWSIKRVAYILNQQARPPQPCST